ncbi:hypothetical protein [Pseudoxanthomonas sp.]|jgi:hypothetical protein|uniref:hypothetical protein n=1 Tax=Pseudoxanthomonas sp. TaxID=1871049 RepID=UPI002E10AEA9|nr:hypothetical protein [Pseudoxanthomonas sp.]
MSLLNPVATSTTPLLAVDDTRVQLLRSLLADCDWSPPAILRGRLQQAMALLREPGVSLDEATWLLVADETARYLDFRRLRSLEAQLRGCAYEALHYTRADWEAARNAEAALESHLRQVRFSSYAPEPVPMFRIH